MLTLAVLIAHLRYLPFLANLLYVGFEQVETVNDPIFALKNFKAGSYDLLIVDIVMPEMDGFSLYEGIRKIDNKVKVCFITAFEMNYQALRAVFSAATATDYIGCFIRKPVDMRDLVKIINAEIQLANDRTYESCGVQTGRFSRCVLLSTTPRAFCILTSLEVPQAFGRFKSRARPMPGVRKASSLPLSS